jgi:hypothetical protein
MEIKGENAKLRRFLLGVETETEAAEIGGRIIADGEFAEKMSLAEEELCEEFLDDALTAEETELFYRNFLTTPGRVELLEETALFRSFAQDHPAAVSESQPEEKKTGSFFDRFKGFPAFSWRPIAAVLIIIVLGAIIWRVVFYEARGLSQIEKDYAALNAKDLTNAPETANLSSKSLIAGTFRDTSEAAPELNSANLTEKVLFRLALPPGTSRNAVFDLELIRGGQIVFRQTELRVYQNQSGQELKVILPKSVLSKGAYQIKLNSGALYGFAVE